MYFDLFVPFPIGQDALEQGTKKGGKKDKGKAKSTVVGSGSGSGSGNGEQSLPQPKLDYWAFITQLEKERSTRTIALAGHLGYDVVGCTITSDPSTSVIPNPFARQLPFPNLDPRTGSSSSNPQGSGDGQSQRLGDGRRIVQVTRFHIRLDDHKTHCFAASNGNLLKEYDIISVAPTSEKALQLACTDLCLPGPNQISIITLPLHERPYFFRLNRKQIRQAQRNGVVLELIYSPALFPSSSLPTDVARRFRQNFFTNAREVIRITGGKGVILSSGPGGHADGMRSPVDLINLASVLGMPANLAKDAVSLNGKMLLLRAQARRTFKAVFAAPKIIAAPSDHDSIRLSDQSAVVVGTLHDASVDKRPLSLEVSSAGDSEVKAKKSKI